MEDQRMLRARSLRSGFLSIAIATLAAWIVTVQQPRRVDDTLLKTGGSLSTAGNLVFSSVNNRLLAFRADTGEKLLDLDLHTSQLGPPISFQIDDKQYISGAGGPEGGGGFGAGGAGGAAKGGDAKGPAAPPRPAHLFVLAL